MNELQIFSSPEFGELRTIEEGDKIYFVASDVAKALGYKRPADAVSAHCRYTVKRSIPHTQGKGTLQMNVIPEGDVYRLAVHSELPSAEKFERWVFDEVLPAIRKTGGYQITQVTPNPHYRTRMIGTAIRDVGKTSEALEEVFGVAHGMALAVSMNLVGEAYGVDMAPCKALLPSAKEVSYLNASGVAERIGLRCKTGAPNAAAANQLLAERGLQEKRGKDWHLTEKGKRYGEAKPYNRGGHSGPRRNTAPRALADGLRYGRQQCDAGQDLGRVF